MFVVLFCYFVCFNTFWVYVKKLETELVIHLGFWLDTFLNVKLIVWYHLLLPTYFCDCWCHLMNETYVTMCLKCLLPPFFLLCARTSFLQVKLFYVWTLRSLMQAVADGGRLVLCPLNKVLQLCMCESECAFVSWTSNVCRRCSYIYHHFFSPSSILPKTLSNAAFDCSVCL